MAAKRKYPRILKGGTPGRKPIGFRAMTDVERQRRHRARNKPTKDARWLRYADPEFAGIWIATAIFDFLKGKYDADRWCAITDFANKRLEELQQEFSPKRDPKRRRNDIRDYVSVLD